MNELEVLQVKVQTAQLAARAIGIDPELYVSAELQDEVRSANPELGGFLDAFAAAFDAWSGFQKRIEREDRQGGLTAEETKELFRLRREKDDARSRLLAKVNEAKSAPSWVHGVIDPLLSSLAHPMFFLNKGGYTWRFRTKALEWVRPIREYFDPGEHALLDACFGRLRLVAERATAWDRDRDELERAATAEWDYLHALPAFLDAYDQCLADYLRQPNPHNLRPEPWGAGPKEHARDLVAEHVVNNRNEIESHNTTAVFWHDYSTQILQAIGCDETWQRLNASTEALGARLRERGNQLCQELQTARDHLIQEYAHVARPPHIASD